MPKTNIATALVLSTFGLCAMAGMSAAVHEASASAPIGQVMFWRSFVALFPTVLYLLWRGHLGPSLRTSYPLKHLTRGVLGCITMFFSFMSLRYLSVGMATALVYLAPIFSIIAAVVFLRERPGVSIFVGIVLGFAGIILMLFPTLVSGEVRDGTLIGVAAGVAMAATNAVSRVQVKDLTRTDPPASIALSFAVICTLVGLATSIFGWAELDLRSFALLAGAGLLGGIGHVLMMESVARAPVSVLAPYEYTGIIWAFGFDIVLLGASLSLWSVGGALLVVLAAALVAYGQGVFRRPVTANA